LELSEEILNQLRGKLQNFQKTNFEGKTVEDVKNELHEFYNSYSIVIANLGRCPVFRVRKIENSHEHNTLKDVWCPSASFVKKLGRANNIGESMFYGALDYETAIKEVDVKIGESFSLAVYNLKEKENFERSSVVIRPSIPSGYYCDSMSLFGLELSDFIVYPGEETKYIRSCAISSILLNLPYKDSLLYPSVKNNDSVNIVMKELDAKIRLSLNLVLTCQCISLNNYVVFEVKQPTTDGYLHLLHNLYKQPPPLRVNAPKMSFETMFSDQKILSSAQEIEDLLSSVLVKR